MTYGDPKLPVVLHIEQLLESVREATEARTKATIANDLRPDSQHFSVRDAKAAEDYAVWDLMCAVGALAEGRTVHTEFKS